jgi:hypothetical protein
MQYKRHNAHPQEMEPYIETLTWHLHLSQHDLSHSQEASASTAISSSLLSISVEESDSETPDSCPVSSKVGSRFIVEPHTGIAWKRAISQKQEARKWGK